MTGNPKDIASAIEIPKASDNEGSTNPEASSYAIHFSFPNTELAHFIFFF